MRLFLTHSEGLQNGRTVSAHSSKVISMSRVNVVHGNYVSIFINEEFTKLVIFYIYNSLLFLDLGLKKSHQILTMDVCQICINLENLMEDQHYRIIYHTRSN